jgi:hypothetical protein
MSRHKIYVLLVPECYKGRLLDKYYKELTVFHGTMDYIVGRDGNGKKADSLIGDKAPLLYE